MRPGTNTAPQNGGARKNLDPVCAGVRAHWEAGRIKGQLEVNKTSKHAVAKRHVEHLLVLANEAHVLCATAP